MSRILTLPTPASAEVVDGGELVFCSPRSWSWANLGAKCQNQMKIQGDEDVEKSDIARSY
jgi:hypothetical protein